jgi:hypothetical protein
MGHGMRFASISVKYPVMNKILLSLAAATALIFGINSCSKTGPTGPAGPLSTGTLTGFVTVYDQYGFKVLGDLSGATVSIPGQAGDTGTTNPAGAYAINNLKTGIYNLVYSQTGCGTVLANDVSFLGGGTINRNQTLSLIPSFSLFGANIIDTVEATDSGVLIRGVDTVNSVARTFIVFAGSASTVSSTPSTYVYENTNTIKAGGGAWSLFIPSQALIDAGLPAYSMAYFVVYPYSTGQATYVDLSTGKTVFPALGTPTTVLSVLVP